MKHPNQKDGISRRDFLIGSGMSVGGLLLQAAWSKAASVNSGLPTEVFRVLWDEGLLDLEFRFINFRRRGDSLRSLGFGRSLVAVRFPPQNLAEALFDEGHLEPGRFENDPIDPAKQPGAPPNDPRPPVNCFLSGPSWLVFQVPDGMNFPLKVELWVKLLCQCELRVPRGAIGPAKPAMPALDETRLEIPFRLFIAPGRQTYWSPSGFSQGASLGQLANGFREVWHASLRSEVPVRPSGLPPGMVNLPPEVQPPKRIRLHARAVYSPDFLSPGQNPSPSLYYPGDSPLSLHALTRHRLVAQMAAGEGQIDVENLILSSLGANASLFYASQKPVERIIEEQLAGGGPDTAAQLRLWKHRMVIGRDVFFAEACFGFLFPFAFPAIYVEITQRKFGARKIDKEKVGPPGAYLLKRRFIIVQDPVKNFVSSESAMGRSMPLKRVTLKTMVSPDLVKPSESSIIRPDDDKGRPFFKADYHFWPKLLTTGEPVLWEIECEDVSGHKFTTSDAQFVFVDHIRDGHNLYSSTSEGKPLTEPERTIPFPAVKCALAPEKPLIYLPIPPLMQGVDIDWTIEEAERQWAAGIGARIRGIAEEANRAGTEVADAVESLKRKAREQEGKPLQLDPLQTKITDRFDAELEKLGQWFSDDRAKFFDAADRILEKLQGAEKVAASLETHAMTFGSHLIKDEVGTAETLLDEIRRETALSADDVTNKVIGVLRKLDGEGEFKKRMEEQLTDLQSAVRGQFASADANLQKADQEVRRRFGEYLQGMKEARDQAAKIGSKYLHLAMDKAEAVVPALKGAVDVPVRELEFFRDYVVGGVRTVQNGVYAELREAVWQGGKLADEIKNGLAKPAGLVAGLSRELGAVMAEGKDKVREIGRHLQELGTSNLRNIDMTAALPDATLFGKIPLKQILGTLARGQIPNINLVEIPEKIEKTWEWVAPVKTTDFAILKFVVNDADTRLKLHFVTTLPLKPKPDAPTIEMNGYLGKYDEKKNEPIPIAAGSGFSFALNLLDLIEVRFRQLQITAKYIQGEFVKPDVHPDFGAVEFLGPMKFVGQLQEKLAGMLGGLRIDVAPEFVTVGFATSLPAISFGAFSLANISISSDLGLPFGDSALYYKFGFSSWKKPFELGVMGFTGRGYFGAAFDSSGFRQLEGALEFGGALSFSVVVASGGVYVMAGAYFRINNSMTELAGYLRAGGNLNVLGIINVDVEFLLMVRYRNKGGQAQLHGSCTITVSIDLFFFSKDVSIEMEKEIAGSSDQPYIKQRKAYAYEANQADTSTDIVAAERPCFFNRRNQKGRFGKSDWASSYWSHIDR